MRDELTLKLSQIDDKIDQALNQYDETSSEQDLIISQLRENTLLVEKENKDLRLE